MSGPQQSAASRCLNWGLERIGVDARVYRSLVSAYLLMDFRNQQFGRATATAGAKEILTPLFTVTGQNLLIGLFASVAMFARVDAFFFALAAITISMIVAASSVVVEFNEIVFDPDDLHVIGHQPIPVRTYSAARVTNLLAYVLLTIASLNFFPALIGTGLRDSGWWFLPLYFLAALTSNLIIAAVVILTYNVILGDRPTPQLRELLAWVQVAAMLLLGYGGQLAIRDPQQKLQMLAYDLPAWARLTPPGWLAGMVTGLEPAIGSMRWGIAAITIVGTVFIWGWVIVRLSATYARLEPGRSAWARATLRPLPSPGELVGTFARLITRRGEERSAYWLCRTFLRRDYNLKMRCWTSLGVVIAAVAMGWVTGQLHDPMQVRDAKCVFTLACIYLLAIPLPQLMHNLNFSKDFQASWLLSVSPITDSAAWGAGLRKAVTFHFMAPLLLFLFLVFLLVWGDIPHALLHVLIAGLTIQGVAYVCSIGVVRSVPFAAPLARSESFGAIAPFASAVGAMTTGLGLLHFAALQVQFGVLAYTLSLAGIVFFLRQLSRTVLARRVVASVDV